MSLSPKVESAQLRPDDRLMTRIISLLRATERRSLAEAEWRKVGLQPVFFDACDMQDPAVQAEMAKLVDHSARGPYSAHDKACTLSHLAVMREFLASSKEFCLVAEDDIFVSGDMAEWLSDMSWWPKGAEIVRFERWRTRNRPVILDRQYSRHLGREIRRMRSKHAGGAAYMLSRAGAERVLRHDPPTASIDQYLFNSTYSSLARALKVYQVVPALVVQGNEPVGSINNTRSALGKKTLRQRLHLGKLHHLLLAPWHLSLLASGRSQLVRVAYVDRATPPVD